MASIFYGSFGLSGIGARRRGRVKLGEWRQNRLFLLGILERARERDRERESESTRDVAVHVTERHLYIISKYICICIYIYTNTHTAGTCYYLLGAYSASAWYISSGVTRKATPGTLKGSSFERPLSTPCRAAIGTPISAPSDCLQVDLNTSKLNPEYFN